jgi:hypothetical protein
MLDGFPRGHVEPWHLWLPSTPQGLPCSTDAQCVASDGASHACDLQTLHCFDNNIYQSDLVESVESVESSATLRLSPVSH